jgi:PAS domain S-box-containing protein
VIIDLIYNLALLVALSVVSGFVETRWARDARRGAILQGLVFGGAAVIGMVRPLVIAPGLIFDGRSVMISLGARFFGPWAAAVACLMTIPLRIWQGGSGTAMGVLVILTSALIGGAFHHYHHDKGKEVSAAELMLFGLLVHVAMLLMTLALPSGMALPVLRQIGLPVMTTYPLATVLIGKILSDHAARRDYFRSLQASEEQFRAMFELASVGMAEADLQSRRWLRVNRKMCEIAGYSSEELLRKTVEDLTHPEDRECGLQLVQSALNGQKSEVRVEQRWCRRDGTIVWVHINKTVIRDVAGKPLRTLSAIEDITERRRLEQERWVMELEQKTHAQLEAQNRAYQENLERLVQERTRQLQAQAELLDLAQDAISVRDMAGGVRYWNKSCERITGWSAAEVMGRRVQDFLNPGRIERDESLATLLREGNWSGETIVQTRAGRRVTLLSRWTLVRDDHGQPDSVLAIETDITEQKRLESQFLRAQRMDSLGRLASGIAHDLNNILSPILMGTALLRSEVKSPEGASLLETLAGSAQRGSDVVRQLLAFARGSEGERVPVSLGRLVREMARIIEETFPKQLTLETQVPKDIWMVRGDPTQLHQVLLNLCVNARDAMPGSGLLKLSIENVMLDEQGGELLAEGPAGPYVLLRVSDTGVGIPPEVIDRIFDPFFTTKSPETGTGLGLATVQGIVKGHDGLVRVESYPGKGTEFRVYIPALPSAKSSVTTATLASLPKGNGELILVIDDELSLREVTGRILTRYGYRLLAASEGSAGLALFEAHREQVRLVITDMMMPGMDGKATIQALRSNCPGLLIIASSGVATQPSLDEIKALNVSAFLQKPFSTQTLLNTVHQVLSGAG